VRLHLLPRNQHVRELVCRGAVPLDRRPLVEDERLRVLAQPFTLKLGLHALPDLDHELLALRFQFRVLFLDLR
jgi:hypothetical protein